jgi:O-succinylbenzoic acid--CoA ligase
MPNGQAFVSRLIQAWDNGDAVFPLDQRLPPPARAAALSAARPTIIATSTHDTAITGDKVEVNDALVVATSGTTGAPKAAVLTHDAVLASARATSARLGITTNDCWLACLPPSHVGGLSVITRAILMGTPLVTQPAFSPEGYADAARNGATLVALVSTAMQRVDTSLFRTIVLGGSRPPHNRASNCVATYGMTETGSGVVYDGIPLDGVEIRIVDTVIELRAPMLLRAYRNGIVPLDAQGWFRTGDIGTLNANGVLQVQGREGDLIISGGENVWPETVEESLSQLASIHEVCVVGINDKEWGQKVVAFVVPSATGAPTLEELRNTVKETLPSFCAPKEMQIVESIPRTALGKPQRRELANTYAS